MAIFPASTRFNALRWRKTPHDLGEYLVNLHLSGELNTRLGDLSGRAIYYPPCHQREQEIGMPYLDLLSLIPGMNTEPLQSSFFCCGMAGIMGFKRDFHTASLHIGSRLIAKIKEINPDRLLTDCLSCWLQFIQTTPYEVHHPIEILRDSYAKGSASVRKPPPAAVLPDPRSWYVDEFSECP